MKVAVLSDIHSNFHAFEACFKDAVNCGADMFIFLGDYISDLSEPTKTMNLVYEVCSCYPTVCLRGNRERYMLDCENGNANFIPGTKSGSLLFTYEHLRKKDLTFFRSLKFSDTIEIDGIEIEIAHAVFDNDCFYFDNLDGGTSGIFQRMNCKYLLPGHSHKQYITGHTGKTMINPGSAGIPHGGTPHAKYTILNTANGSICCELREVPYDIAGAIHAQFANGLVDYGKYWATGILHDIITGEEWTLKLLEHVQQSGSICDEKAWHNAAIDLGMKFSETDIMAMFEKSFP